MRTYDPRDLATGFQIVEPMDEGPSAPCAGCGARAWAPGEKQSEFTCRACGAQVVAVKERVRCS